MKSKIGVIISAVIAIMIGGSMSAAASTSQCPQGTTYSYVVDGLNSDTYTVPTPPSGWTVLGVIANTNHGSKSYIPASSGQVLNVKQDTGHKVRWVEICKASVPETTTTTVAPTTTAAPTTVPETTAPTTTIADTTTTTPTVDTTVPPTVQSTVVTTAPPVVTLPATGVSKTEANTLAIGFILILVGSLAFLAVRRPRSA